MDLNIELNARTEKRSMPKAAVCAGLLLATVGYSLNRGVREEVFAQAKNAKAATAATAPTHPVDKFVKSMDKLTKALTKLNTEDSGDCSHGNADFTDVASSKACVKIIKTQLDTLGAKPAKVYAEEKKKAWNAAHKALKDALLAFKGEANGKKTILDKDNPVWAATKPDNADCPTDENSDACSALMTKTLADLDAPAKTTEFATELLAACDTNGVITQKVAMCEGDKAGKQDCMDALAALAASPDTGVVGLWRSSGDLSAFEGEKKTKAETCVANLKTAVLSVDNNKDDKVSFTDPVKAKLHSMFSGLPEDTSRIMYYVLGGLAVVLLCGGGVFFYLRSKKAAAGEGQPGPEAAA